MMHCTLRTAGIVQIVEDKIEAAPFHAMQRLFLVGNVVKSAIGFEIQAKREFDKLLKLQGNGGTTIDLERLKTKALRAH